MDRHQASMIFKISSCSHNKATSSLVPCQPHIRLSMSAINIAIAFVVSSIPATPAFPSPHHRSNALLKHHNQLSAAVATSKPPQTIAGKRIPINESYPGLKRVHTSPDVFIITNFLDDASCQDLIDRAKEKGTSRSPVAYAGWTDDVKDLLGLAASGPVTW